MTDRVIPEAAAKAAAQLLRAHKDDIPDDTRFSPLSLAAMLDPPRLPSLRDEVARLVDIGAGMNFSRLSTADEILAVVRRRVEMVQTPPAMRGDGWTDAADLNDVLQLLGGAE